MGSEMCIRDSDSDGGGVCLPDGIGGLGPAILGCHGQLMSGPGLVVERSGQRQLSGHGVHGKHLAITHETVVDLAIDAGVGILGLDSPYAAV